MKTKRILLARSALCITVLTGLFTVSTAFAAAQDTTALLDAYYTYLLLESTVNHTLTLDPAMSPHDQQQIKNSNEQWLDFSLKKLRRNLGKKLGHDAKTAFRAFVADYTAAEKAGNTAFLQQLARAADMQPAPADYTTFSSRYTDAHLAPQINYCARYISEVQTWLDIKSRTPHAPNLQQWLTKDDTPKKRAPAKKKKPSALNALAAAEAPLPDYVPDEDDDMENPMDAFSQMRSQRRERVMEQAQAGMAQVAAEREAAESAYAEKKATAAQAEADAVAAQARKLASAEEDALSQRQNSWSARLKRLVSGTLSGAVGAFTGGIGAEAGVRAANAVFDNDR
jgi:hypothetical protein